MVDSTSGCPKKSDHHLPHLPFKMVFSCELSIMSWSSYFYSKCFNEFVSYPSFLGLEFFIRPFNIQSLSTDLKIFACYILCLLRYVGLSCHLDTDLPEWTSWENSVMKKLFHSDSRWFSLVLLSLETQCRHFENCSSDDLQAAVSGHFPNVTYCQLIILASYVWG